MRRVDERRWTGIEPAGRGSPVPAALKAVEPTRCPDTSSFDPTYGARRGALLPSASMNKVVKLLLIILALGFVVFAVQKVRGS